MKGPDPFQCEAILGEIELQNLHFRVCVEGNKGENHEVYNLGQAAVATLNRQPKRRISLYKICKFNVVNLN